MVKNVLLQGNTHIRHRSHQWGQPKQQVAHNMSVVLLASKRLQRGAVQRLRILAGRIFWLIHILTCQNSIYVPDANGLIHPAIGFVHVVHLRRTLGKLQLRLRHSDSLGNGENVRVGHRQNVDSIIKVPLLDLARLPRHIIRVLIRQVIRKTLGQQLELQLLRIMQPLVNSGHDRGALLQQRNGRTHCRILIAVAYLQIRNRRHTTARIHTETHQRKQRLAWLLVRQRQERLLQVHAARINVAPLARRDRHIIILDPRTLGLEARWQVAQRTRIGQLTQRRRSRLRQTTNQVQKAQAIRTGTLDQQVVDVVLLTLFQVLFLFPIATNTHHALGYLINRDHVRQADTRRLSVFILVFKAGEVVIDLELQQIYLFLFPTRHNTCDLLVLLLNNLALLHIHRRISRIQILATYYRLAVRIQGHREAVGNALTLAHD